MPICVIKRKQVHYLILWQFYHHMKCKFLHCSSHTRYCYLKFDGDEYRLSNTMSKIVDGGYLMLKEPGDTVSRRVATPFKKYYNSEDYVYCSHPISCHIFIGGTKMLDLKCRYYYLTIKVYYLILW